MSLRMQLRRIVKVIMTHDYWICGTLISPEFIPVKSTKLFMKVFTVFCVHVMHEKQIPKEDWICLKCPHTSHYEGDQFLNCQHAWTCWEMVALGIVLKFPDWQSSAHFPWPNELTMCPDINGFQMQIPVKTSCTEDTDDVKLKTSLFYVEWKSAWKICLVVVLLFYVICVRYTK